MTNWQMVTGEDGKEYLEFSGQVTVPWNKSTDQSGSALVAMAQVPGLIGGAIVASDSSIPPGTAYTLSGVDAMRGGFGYQSITYDDLVRRDELARDYDELVRDDGVVVRREPQLNQLNNPMNPRWQMSPGSWSIGPPVADDSGPEHPAGRFQNLDWEEAS